MKVKMKVKVKVKKLRTLPPPGAFPTRETRSTAPRR